MNGPPEANKLFDQQKSGCWQARHESCQQSEPWMNMNFS